MQGMPATVHQLTHLCDPPDTVRGHLLLTRLSRANRRLAHQPAKPQLYQYSVFWISFRHSGLDIQEKPLLYRSGS